MAGYNNVAIARSFCWREDWEQSRKGPPIRKEMALEQAARRIFAEVHKIVETHETEAVGANRGTRVWVREQIECSL